MLDKGDFPIFKNCPDLVYLDGAATSQKPQAVLDSERFWYEKFNANTHRGLYGLSVLATGKFESARHKIADYFGFQGKETIFTKNATEGINLIAQGYKKYLKPGDNIVISALEHHSNILPWREIAKEKRASIKIINVKDGRTSLESAKKLINQRTKIVSVAHVSHVFGTVQPVSEIAKLARQAGAIMVIDGAQAVAHLKPFSNTWCWKMGELDAYVFSGHKVYGPNGIGVVFIKQSLAQKLDRFMLGGATVERVWDSDYRLRPAPWRFEAGTQNCAAAVALAKALELFYKDFDRHRKKLELLKTKLYNILEDAGAIIYSPKDLDVPIISFNFPGKSASQTALMFNARNIAARSGFLCAEPLVSQLSGSGVVRVSAGLWNDEDDVEKFKKALKKMI